LLKAHLGRDPAAERRAQRAGARQAHERDDDLFGTLAHLYLEKHAKLKKRSWRLDELTIERDLGDWKRRPAKAITPTDVEAVLERIVERGAPVQANRTRAIISKIFNFGLKSPSARLRFGLTSNPVLGTERPHVERARDRVLTADELRLLWHALDEEPADSAAVLRLELLTAQRGGEVRTMRREDLDLEPGWWTIPAERAKNGTAHRVPLSPPALAIVTERVKRVPVTTPWLFPASHGAHTDTEAHPFRASVRKAIERLRLRAGIDFRGHDLRRTAASHMAAMGIPRLVIGRILNHVEPGVTKVYDRHSYDPEKRQALDAWARRLHAIVTGESVPKVVELRRS